MKDPEGADRVERGSEGHSRQPKESEKGFSGMISKGKRILMLKLS